MRVFKQELAQHNPPADGERTWVYLPYDQLNDQLGVLADLAPEKLALVFIESKSKAETRPYHKAKLYFVLSNMRHFALEQAKRGAHIRYLFTEDDYATALRDIVPSTGPLVCMRPAEREMRALLYPLFQGGQLIRADHDGWLTTKEDFEAAVGDSPPWRMDTFYRHMRNKTGWLMDEAGKPEGGKFSHDADNRQPYKGEPVAPELPLFPVDAVDAEVVELVEQAFAHHPGELHPDTIPTTMGDALQAWEWAKERCMTHFGPFEDAMCSTEPNLFHTRLSPLLNNHRLLAAGVLADALALDIPLNSKEGFVRQILGWREFVRHVHEQTDGFRKDGTTPDALTMNTPLPPVFWGGKPSGLACLDQVVDDVWREGYSHHITRLMVLTNIGMLLDIDANQLSDWFWVAYMDAYDWVVQPNVLAMGLFATGEVMTTKPYVAGSGYIHRMSDYCKSCAFHPKKTCPLTPMYWAYLTRHESSLAGCNRIGRQLGAARKRSEAQKTADNQAFEHVRDTLAEGAQLTP